MTWIRKFSGDRTAPIVCTYTCPEHGEFDAEVVRDENGEAPDTIMCPLPWDCRMSLEPCEHPCCSKESAWTPSPVRCRVRLIEAVKGKWQKPERETYLDTRELGEGMDMDEWQAKRAAIWERRRQEDVMKFKKGLL